MLHQFLTSNRAKLITRCKNKAAKRFAPSLPPAPIDHGVPLFLQQLVDTLLLETTHPAGEIVEPLPTPAPTEIGRTAAMHGAELLRLGYTIDQVVHDYGDVCQTVTELAGEEDERITAGEFRTLNRCLDNAIADAVTSFGQARHVLNTDHAVTLEQRLRSVSDEYQRLTDIALKSYAAIRTGSVGVTGATGTLLLHTLEDLHSIADRKLPEIRMPI
jgi:hypothetical protein